MRLNTIKPGEGSKKAAKLLAAGLVPVSVKPVVVATKVRSPVPAVSTRSALRAVKCRCSAACRSVASIR